jgi:hypothetical protein
MTALGTQDAVGLSHFPEGKTVEFHVPAIPTGGTNRDVGTLALFLIANWFVNGETVLIDGGVSRLVTSLVFIAFIVLGLDPPQTSFLVLMTEIFNMRDYYGTNIKNEH